MNNYFRPTNPKVKYLVGDLCGWQQWVWTSPNLILHHWYYNALLGFPPLVLATMGLTSYPKIINFTIYNIKLIYNVVKLLVFISVLVIIIFFFFQTLIFLSIMRLYPMLIQMLTKGIEKDNRYQYHINEIILVKLFKGKGVGIDKILTNISKISVCTYYWSRFDLNSKTYIGKGLI